MNVPSWPLLWPPGWKRAGYRKASPFRHGRDRLQIRDALNRLMPELERMGVRALDVVVSTNVRPHLYDQAGVTGDPGAAVYFEHDGAPMVLACDKWDRVADNLAAIAAHVEALRGQERWGVGSLAQAVAGYKALPAVPARRNWWEVLGLASHDASVSEIRAARDRLLLELHPDRPGGDQDRAAEVNAAYREALGNGARP